MKKYELLIETLKEYIWYLIKAISSESIISGVTLGARQKYESEIAQIESDLAKEEPEGVTAEDYTKKINSMIKWGKDNVPHFEENELSDGYHTFNELYEFRKVFNACLFNEWALQDKHEVHKSWKHNNGELCFGGGWFIVIAILPDGQISNHYKEDEWELFKIPITEKALYKFDGHTPKDVIIRLNKLNESYASSKQIDLRITDADIEAWADSKWNKLAETLEYRIGLNQGAKAMRDGKIKHLNNL